MTEQNTKQNQQHTGDLKVSVRLYRSPADKNVVLKTAGSAFVKASLLGVPNDTAEYFASEGSLKLASAVSGKKIASQLHELGGRAGGNDVVADVLKKAHTKTENVIALTRQSRIAALADGELPKLLLKAESAVDDISEAAKDEKTAALKEVFNKIAPGGYIQLEFSVPSDDQIEAAIENKRQSETAQEVAREKIAERAQHYFDNEATGEERHAAKINKHSAITVYVQKQKELHDNPPPSLEDAAVAYLNEQTEGLGDILLLQKQDVVAKFEEDSPQEYEKAKALAEQKLDADAVPLFTSAAPQLVSETYAQKIAKAWEEGDLNKAGITLEAKVVNPPFLTYEL